MLLYRGLGQGQSQSANSHFYWNDDEMLNCWVVEGRRWGVCVGPLGGFLWGHLGWHSIYVGTHTHNFTHLHPTVTCRNYIQVHLHLHSHYNAFTLHYFTLHYITLHYIAYTSTFTSIFTLAFTLAHVIVCLCVCLCLCVCVSVCFCVFLSVPEGRCSDSPSVRKSVCLF